MSLGNPFLSVFTAGEDLEKPELIEAWRITNNGPNEELAGGIVSDNRGWEKDDRLSLRFSEPVDALSVKNCLSAEGAPTLRMETLPGLRDEVIFCFENPPPFESRFSFRQKCGARDASGKESGGEYIFKIFVNGPLSKPPALIGIRLPMMPGSAADPELISYGIDSLFDYLPVAAPGPFENAADRYPYNTRTETWIECYFETAPGHEVDILSLMALFRVDTSNNVLSFSPRLVKDSGFSIADPRPGWELYQRLEIRGFLTNTVNSGVVYIEIGSGLKDTKGNINEKAGRICLLK
jgi:hypothetical protein